MGILKIPEERLEQRPGQVTCDLPVVAADVRPSRRERSALRVHFNPLAVINVAQACVDRRHFQFNVLAHAAVVVVV